MYLYKKCMIILPVIDKLADGRYFHPWLAELMLASDRLIMWGHIWRGHAARYHVCHRDRYKSEGDCTAIMIKDSYKLPLLSRIHHQYHTSSGESWVFT